MRRALVVAVVVLSGSGVTCAGGLAATAARHPHARLEAYVRKVGVEIRVYRRILSRARELLTAEDPDVGAQIEGIRDVSGRLERLSGRWSRIRSPAAVRFHHRRMGAAFALQGDLFSAFADGLEQAVATGDQAPAIEALERAQSLAPRLTHVQKQWAATVRGLLRRAHLRVPKWLTELAQADEGPTR
jgi:hypothetical protein